MRGLLILGDAYSKQRHPEPFLRDPQRQNFKILYENAAEYTDPPLFLSHAQLQFSRLRRNCEWTCVLAEGTGCAYALILGAQLCVDRLILIGDQAFVSRHPDRRMRRINAFARRNLSLITAEIISAGMGERALRQLSSGLGVCCGGLLHLSDAAELWPKRESFLTLPFETLSAPLQMQNDLRESVEMCIIPFGYLFFCGKTRKGRNQ